MNGEARLHDAELRPGSLIGARYRLTDKLGEGGFAVVWGARDERLSRDVAMKFFVGEDRRAAYRMGMFEREAEALRRLDHPAIGRCFSSERDDRHVFIVLEFIPGETMHRAMIERFRHHQPLSFDEIARWSDVVLDALQHAHAAGLVHRDLKPANLMMTGGEPPVRLLDFGVAKLLDDDAADSATTMGRIIGTPTYLSPEQISHGQVEPRSDLFAFGTLLFEMVTGRKLWIRDATDAPADVWSLIAARKDNARNSPQAISHRILFGTRPSMLTYRPDAPAALDNLCQRLLEPVAEKRPANAQRVRALLADAFATRTSTFGMFDVSVTPTASDAPMGETTPVMARGSTGRSSSAADTPEEPGPGPKPINRSVTFPASIGLASSGSIITTGEVPEPSPPLRDHLGTPEIGGMVLAASGIGLMVTSAAAGAGVIVVGAAVWAMARRSRRREHGPTLQLIEAVHRHVGFKWRSREEHAHATIFSGALVRPVGGGAGAVEVQLPLRELIPLRYRPTIEATLARDPAVLFQRSPAPVDWPHISNLILCDPSLTDRAEVEELLAYVGRRTVQACVVGAKLRIELGLKRTTRAEQVTELWHACSAALVTARWLDRESARVRAWREGRAHA